MNIQSVKKINDSATGLFFAYEVLTDEPNIRYTVPHNEENSDYQAIQKWVAEGNTIED
jgi:hypothetical protein